MDRKMHSLKQNAQLGSLFKFLGNSASTKSLTNIALKIFEYSLPQGKISAEKVVAIPNRAQKDGVCLRWSFKTSGHLCVGVDNVVVTSSTNRASSLHADLDPFRASDWYSFPGGVITVLFLRSFLILTSDYKARPFSRMVVTTHAVECSCSALQR